MAYTHVNMVARGQDAFITYLDNVSLVLSGFSHVLIIFDVILFLDFRIKKILFNDFFIEVYMVDPYVYKNNYCIFLFKSKALKIHSSEEEVKSAILK